MGNRLNPSTASSTGFTFVELIISLTIATALSAMILSAATRSTQRSRILRAQAELGAIAGALESYRRTFGDYPQTARGDVLVQSLIGRLGPLGAAVEARSFLDVGALAMMGDRDPEVDSTAECRDPWDRAYIYAYKSETPWTQAAFVLYSKGPDGTHVALLTGGRVDEVSAENLDNVYLNP
ncbi:MAG: hypothetical protein ABIV50_13975 [Opitutus sp.]